MRLSDARLRRPKPKLIYVNHRLPHWPTEDASPRDRSNRLLDVEVTPLNKLTSGQRGPALVRRISLSVV
jgi:hypothetical protein